MPAWLSGQGAVAEQKSATYGTQLADPNAQALSPHMC